MRVVKKPFLWVFVFFFFLSGVAQAKYVSKFWLDPKSQQIQITNLETKSMIIVGLEYDALKMFLYSYDIIHAGNYDKELSHIKTARDLERIIPLIGRVEYISMSHERFGLLDENFISYSVFGPEPNEPMSDVDLIKRLLNQLFKNETQIISARNTSSCVEFL